MQVDEAWSEQVEIDLQVARSEAEWARHALGDFLDEARNERKEAGKNRSASAADRVAAASDRREAERDRVSSAADRDQAEIDSQLAWSPARDTGA